VASAGTPRPRGILPRSLHLAVAVTDGSLKEKINKIGVRLWTACTIHRQRQFGFRGTNPQPSSAQQQMCCEDRQQEWTFERARVQGPTIYFRFQSV
jgi:hypothetical protein